MIFPRFVLRIRVPWFFRASLIEFNDVAVRGAEEICGLETRSP